MALKKQKETQKKQFSESPSEFTFSSTADIDVPKNILDQVIGQEEAVNLMHKAARQKRHVLLIGDPGTGKSMLGLGLAELLPKSELKDVVAFPNPHDENNPLIREVPLGEGRALVASSRIKAMNVFSPRNILLFILVVIAMIAPWYALEKYKSDVIFAAFFIGGMIFLGSFVLFMSIGKRMNQGSVSVPKVIVDNFGRSTAPFNDATGAHAGALLGDVLHDPFQSGGLGTPAHERIVAGMLHKSNRGVLFIDEIGTMEAHTQQELLTAMQEKKYPITGQSERSAGAMVRTEPVPCDFILLAAGNVETIKNLHPALRSRIRGYGYEVYMKTEFKDTAENRMRVARFIAQEVKRDKKIPHFSPGAVEVMLEEARRRASRKGHLTLRFRDLGGLVRAAGDLAVEKGAKIVESFHVYEAKKTARNLEAQITDDYLEKKKEYDIIITTGKKVGRVNGLGIVGGDASMSGDVLVIEAEVTPGGRKNEVIATGKLGTIAKEAVLNVSAIIKKYFGEDIQKTKDIHVQFVLAHAGVEGDSASIAVATAIISALKKIPIHQNLAMTGSLSVLGEVLPVGGVSYKVEAAIDAGITKVIVPKSNLQDIVLTKEKSKIEIVGVETIGEVLRHALDHKGKEKFIAKIK